MTQYDRVTSQSSSKKKTCFDMTTEVKDDFGHVSDVTCQGWLTIKFQESSRVLEGIPRELVNLCKVFVHNLESGGTTVKKAKMLLFLIEITEQYMRKRYGYL